MQLTHQSKTKHDSMYKTHMGHMIVSYGVATKYSVLMQGCQEEVSVLRRLLRVCVTASRHCAVAQLQKF